MKKCTWYAVLACSAVTLAGCALPENPQVSQPDPPIQPQQPVYTQDSTTPKTATQPKYLDIEEDIQSKEFDEDIEVALPSMVYINDRIFEYGRKLNRWKELDSQSVSMELGDDEAAQMVRCFRRLQNVLGGYSKLRTRLLQAQKVTMAEKIRGEEIFELQKSDIAFLENDCGLLLSDSKDQSVGWNQREEGADLSQLETLIDRYGSNREYEEVIQVWQQVPEFQVPRVQLRTKILYGNALMYLHQEEKASEIYQQVVDQMSDSDEQATDLVSLRKILADLYTASGNYKAAQSQYKKISTDYSNLGLLEEWSNLQLGMLDKSMKDSPELAEYSSLLRNYLGFISEQDGYKVAWQSDAFLTSYPYSPVASNVDFIKAAVTKKADKWFSDFIADVDKLSSEKKFTEALELLETMPTDIISPDKQIRINSKNEELLLAEAVDKETAKMAQIQELQHLWNNGMVLAREQEYDEAIDVFTNLLDTEYGSKAEMRISEIALEAAKADRKKAASLFIRFTKTTDVESKKKLLIEARRLLKDILVRYPEVEIGAKVLGNIQRVEQEMNLLDPTLITIADQAEQKLVVPTGADKVFSTPMQQTEPQKPITETDLETGALQ